MAYFFKSIAGERRLRYQNGGFKRKIKGLKILRRLDNSAFDAISLSFSQYARYLRMTFGSGNDYVHSLCGIFLYDLMDLRNKRTCHVPDIAVLGLQYPYFFRCYAVGSYDDNSILRTVFCLFAYGKSALNKFIDHIFVVNDLAKHHKRPAVIPCSDCILCSRNGIFDAETES